MKNINYETFMNIYKNNDIYFAMSESDRKIIDYIYKLYDCFFYTLMCEGVEKQLLDTLLNIPFFFKYYEDENIEDSYEEIIKNSIQTKDLIIYLFWKNYWPKKISRSYHVFLI